MSASSQTQSRDSILNIFHDITGLTIEDCFHFLNEYQWNLQNILEDFYNGKDFKRKFTHNSNEKIEKNEFQQTSTHDSNLGNFYAKNDRKEQAVENDDCYYAHLLALYGDADESARKQRREGQQHYQQPQQQYRQELQQQYYQQPQQQLKENAKHNPIYHEKQEFLRCGIHSLNNLFQIPRLFTPEYLDSIVREFDKSHINNDYGTLWIGDYDLRILIEAISRYGYQVRQLNFYNGEPIQNLPWDSYFGLLMNLNGDHWFTIKNLNGIYYNLDSTFSNPAQLGQKDALVNYLIRLIQKFYNVYIFAVLQQTNSTYHS